MLTASHAKPQKMFKLIFSDTNSGLAFSPDGNQVAVLSRGSSFHGASIDIYSTTDGFFIRKLNGLFHVPEKLVYHPDSCNILVADSGTKLVHEVTPLGLTVRMIGCEVINCGIRAIACNGPLVAVGKCEAIDGTNRVMLFDYGSGALVRTFGDPTSVGLCQAMRFTPDGRHVVVASMDPRTHFGSLTQWSVDGTFEKRLTSRVAALYGVTDVELTANADWVLSNDFPGAGMTVVSGCDGSVTCVFNEEECGVRWHMNHSVALAQPSSGEVWVLDKFSYLVKVFEF